MTTKSTFSAACEASPTEGRSRGPLHWSRPRTVNEVPRHQSVGRCGPRDVVAEVEDRIEEVFEDEAEDIVEPSHEIESVDAPARRSLCVSHRSLLRFFSMAAPKFSAEVFTSR